MCQFIPNKNSRGLSAVCVVWWIWWPLFLGWAYTAAKNRKLVFQGGTTNCAGTVCQWEARGKVSIAVMHSQGESFQSRTITLYVALTDTLHETVHTASQMQLLLRTSVMLFGRRGTVCKQVSFKRSTNWSRRLRGCAPWLILLALC